jgi:hypothetical protein
LEEGDGTVLIGLIDAVDEFDDELVVEALLKRCGKGLT